MMILLVFLGAVGLGVAAAEQQAAAPQLLKIAAGPAGNESSGVFLFSEERARFSRSTDREVIVYFQWQGLPGTRQVGSVSRSSTT